MRFPRQVRELLEKALEVRDRRDHGAITALGARIVADRFQAQKSRLLVGHFTNPENRRFAKHLRHYEDALFIFLRNEGVEATNWRGEHAMRAGVMVRKCCGGGNRAQAGAEAQAILMSLLRTCHQESPLSTRSILRDSPRPSASTEYPAYRRLSVTAGKQVPSNLKEKTMQDPTHRATKSGRVSIVSIEEGRIPKESAIVFSRSTSNDFPRAPQGKTSRNHDHIKRTLREEV